MKRRLHCKRCKRVLSAPVIRLPVADVHDDEVPWRDEESPTPRGTALVCEKPYRTRVDGPPDPLEFTPQVWMHTGDVLEGVRWTKDMRRLSGCCGPSGCDGPNRVCACGAEIGTELGDCWTPAMFVPEPGATVWHVVLDA